MRNVIKIVFPSLLKSHAFVYLFSNLYAGLKSNLTTTKKKNNLYSILLICLHTKLNRKYSKLVLPLTLNYGAFKSSPILMNENQYLRAAIIFCLHRHIWKYYFYSTTHLFRRYINKSRFCLINMARLKKALLYIFMRLN